MEHSTLIHPKDPIAETLRSYAETILVVTFGLLPIVFLPISFAPFEYTKILFVAIGVFSALVLFSLSALRAGGIALGVSYTVIAVWVIALMSLLASLFSGDTRDSLLGDTVTTHTTSFIVLFALALSTWVLIDAGKKAVVRLYILLAVSAVILTLFHLIRIVAGSDAIFGSVFSANTSSPVGSWNDLGLFFGLLIILSLVALDQLPLTKAGRALFGFVCLAALSMLSVINFFIIWIVLGLTSLALIVYSLTKDRFEGSQLSLTERKSFNTVSLIVSLVVFVTSVVFIVGGASLGAAIADMTGVRYVEVRPSLEATANIARHVYDTNAFFGTGPNRFSDAWRLFRDPSINTTIFWNADFIAGNGYVTTFFVTTGILGALAWIVFLGAFFISGIRMLMYSRGEDRLWYFIGVSSFVGALFILGMSLVYVPGAVILLLGALFAGITVVAERALTDRESIVFSLVTNRRTGFLFTLIVIAIIVGSVSGLYVLGKHYASVRAQTEAIALVGGGNRDGARALFEHAYTLFPSDVPLRRIGELYFVRMNELIGIANPTEDNRAEFAQVVQAAITATESAKKEDPLDSDTYTLLGNIYSTLLGMNVEGAYDRANEALLTARDLNPRNPLPYLNLAILEGRRANYEAARTYTEQAIALRPTMTDAYYYLSQIDIMTGNVEGALRATASIINLEPQNPTRYYQLGVLEAARQNVEGAIRAFEEAVRLDPNYANARYLLAIAYDEVKRPKDALRELDAVLALNPGNENVLGLIRTLKAGDSLNSVPTSTRDRVLPEAPEAVTNELGGVTTDTNPDSPLVTPVNTVPEANE